VSAFFPCYNDEQAIPIMVRSVRQALRWPSVRRARR